MAMKKKEIIEQINSLKSQLPSILKVAEIAKQEGLKIAIDELTENCCSYIKSKCYKESKDSIKALEVVNNFKKYLEGQEQRAKRIEARIAELNIELTKCQLDLFEDSKPQKINTGFSFEDRELFIGDVFETSKREYLMIIESNEHPTNYAIIGTAFVEEMLLQYPKNREILKDTAYLGNIFEDDKLAEFVEKLDEKSEELKEDSDDNTEEPPPQS